MPAPKQASDQTPDPVPDATPKPSSSAQSQYNPAQSQYKNFTNGERWGTVGLNLLAPGVGSIVIMDDWIGAIPQWVLIGSGIPMLLNNGLDNGWGAAGYCMVMVDVTYVFLRSLMYSKKFPKNTASLEPTGFRWAVLPDGNGEVKAYLAYRVEF